MKRAIFVGVTVLATLPATALTAAAAKHSGTAKRARPSKHAGTAISRPAVKPAVAASKQMPIPTPELAARALRSTVTVYVYGADGNVYKSGSGFVIAPGLIATNVHVISGAHRVTIKTSSGNQREGIGLVCADQANDLALLYADTAGMPALPLADTSTVQIGQKVLAAGAPEGLSGTVSEGIVSAIRFYKSAKIFQTSAPISHGSSGGPLLDDRGRVIGITSFTYEDGQNLNFAYAAGYLDALRKSAGTAMTSTAWADDGIPDPEEDARLAKITADRADSERKQAEREERIASLTKDIAGLKEQKATFEKFADKLRAQQDDQIVEGKALLADEKEQSEAIDEQNRIYNSNLSDADFYAQQYNNQAEDNRRRNSSGAIVPPGVAILGGVAEVKFRKKREKAMNNANAAADAALAAKRRYDDDVIKGTNLVDAIQKTHDQLTNVIQQIDDIASKIDLDTAELAALNPDAPADSVPNPPAGGGASTPGVEVSNTTPVK